MIGLADTSLFIAWESGGAVKNEPPDEIAVSVITIGELRLGVLLAGDVESRQRRLATFQLVSSLDPVPIDQAVADAWAGLVATLRDRGQRMPINDSWIAATAIARDMAIVTRDHDFDVVDSVQVVRI
ncbi:MAG: type II toxin-antitoxin system VapC family toxin [Acidimicrobiia bacterium]